MRFSDVARYGILFAVAATANANRREYHMPTTWLPHLATNTLTLLLPDVFRMLPRPTKKAPKAISNSGSSSLIRDVWQAVYIPIDSTVRDNGAWVIYVTPLAAGYLLSHPRFNIYKGEMAEMRVLGFGLDAIPHSATGFALGALVCDVARRAAEMCPPRNRFKPLLELAAQNRGVLAFAALGALTALWEYGEYRIHQHEMAQRGSAELINMQWSADDTLHDLISNTAGCLLAVVLR
jgi:hypothetical protein